jgi:cytochrome P450
MAELLHNPVAMAKTQAEVRQAFTSHTLTESEIVQLPYLQAVIKEVLRLHPPGPLLPHMATEDGVDLSGYRVPKGTQVLVNTWAIGHDPQVWNEPAVFKPERFLEEEFSLQRRDFGFLPFGFGRRSCPGMPLAMRVIPLLLALILGEFDLRLPDGMQHTDVDMTEKFGTVLERAVPLLVVPVPVKK